jgi:hypothetical protein
VSGGVSAHGNEGDGRRQGVVPDLAHTFACMYVLYTTSDVADGMKNTAIIRFLIRPPPFSHHPHDSIPRALPEHV